MAVKMVLASPLRRLAGGASSLDVTATTVGEALEAACQVHPDLRGRLLADGGLRQDLRIFVNKRDIRALDGATTALAEGDEVSLVPLVAGA